MKQRRVMRIAVALVAALGVRAAYALPTQTIAALRAVTCCARHCHHVPERPMVPARCCAVSQDATDQARTVAQGVDGADAVAVTSTPVDLPSTRPLDVVVASLPRGHDRAGPIFLLTRNLRR